MRSAKHLGMAVDLAAAHYDGLAWENAQSSGTMALSYYVQSTEYLEQLWNKLPTEKRTAQRHEENS